MERKNFGFSLVELLIVLGIIGVVASVAFFGMSSYKQGYRVGNAQKDFLNNVRSVMAQVGSGTNGKTVRIITLTPGGSSYSIANTDGSSLRNIAMPQGVTYQVYKSGPPPVLFGSPIGVCVTNRNLTSFSVATIPYRCGNVASDVDGTTYFMYQTSTPNDLPVQDSSSLTVTFSGPGSPNKSVVISGNGMYVDRVFTP